MRTRIKLSDIPVSLAFLLLCLFLALSGCGERAPEKAKPGKINLKETRLASVPEDYEGWGRTTFSADGKQVFYIAIRNGREFVVVASADGENIGPGYDSITFFVTSPDGRRFAFGGKTGQKKHLVVDNKELQSLYHEEVAPSAFSPDGRFVACEIGNLEEKEWSIVVSDGEKVVYRSQVYPDTFRQPAFSPDGRLLVYELGEKRKKRTVFFLDLSTGKIIKERSYADPEQPGNFSFSSDSSRVIYDVTKEGEHFLALQDLARDEEREIELPYVFMNNLGLSPNGKKITYTAIKEGKYFFIESAWESPAQRKESGPYEGVGPANLGPDATTFAYNALKDGKWRTVVGGSEGPEYDKLGEAPVFSPDGERIAYPAMKGGKWVMVVSPSGNPALVNEGPAYDMVVTPVWSPDGRRLVYRTREGTMEEAERFIVIADPETGKAIKEGPINEGVWPPVWSADGKSAAYGARQGRELWWRVEAVE